MDYRIAVSIAVISYNTVLSYYVSVSGMSVAFLLYHLFSEQNRNILFPRLLLYKDPS